MSVAFKKKVRQMKGKQPKSAQMIVDIKVPKKSIDSNMVTTSKNCIAFNWESPGGGTIGICSLSRTGRHTDPFPTLKASAKNIHDLQFARFTDKNLLATADDSGAVKFWDIPDVPTKEEFGSLQPIWNVSRHFKRPSVIQWHSSAKNILGSGSWDGNIHIYDLEAQKAALEVKGLHPDQIQHFVWNNPGNSIISSCQDRFVRVIDEVKAHDGPKQIRLCPLGSTPYFISTGFDKYRHRQLRAWDSRNLSKPIYNRDLGQSTGHLMPFFDPSSNLLFLAGKGDTQIKAIIFSGQDPWLHETHVFFGKTLQRGITMGDPTDVDTFSGELVKMYKLCDRNIQPVSFCVPQTKDEKNTYIEEFYPSRWGREAGCSSAQWLGGSDQSPKLVSVEPSEKAKADAAAKSVSLSSAAHADRSGTLGYGVFHQTGAGKTDRTDLKRKSITPKTTSFVRSSKFRHLYSEADPQSQWVRNLTVSTHCPPESPLIAANSKFFAYLYQSNTGSVQVMKTRTPYRIKATDPVIRAHTRPVNDIAFSPFNSHTIVTGGDEGIIRVWDIPEDGLDSDLTSFSQELVGHQHVIKVLKFHPSVNNLLSSASLDGTVRLWDISSGQEWQKIDASINQGEGAVNSNTELTDISWNWHGNLLAVGRKDTKALIFDPRTNKAVHEWSASKSPKGLKLCFAGRRDDHIVTTGWAPGGRRVNVWDLKNLSKPVMNFDIDTSPGFCVPYYDSELDLLWLSSRGEAMIRVYELDFEKKQMYMLPEFRSKNSQLGTAFLPKFENDITEINVATAARLVKDHMELVKFYIPRRHKDLFHDDMFPPTAGSIPAAEIETWFNGSGQLAPKVVNMCPDGMMNYTTSEHGQKKQTTSTRSKILKEGEIIKRNIQDHVRESFESAVTVHEVDGNDYFNDTETTGETWSSSDSDDDDDY